MLVAPHADDFHTSRMGRKQNREDHFVLVRLRCPARLPNKSDRSFWAGQRRVNRFGRIGISQIGRLNPAGINTPVKKVVESIVRIPGDADQRSELMSITVPN